MNLTSKLCTHYPAAVALKQRQAQSISTVPLSGHGSGTQALSYFMLQTIFSM